ncbi:MAG TPA: hypothetical protein HPP56_02075 [Nitrospirae bacterium]|nr:hypothetical protein [Nitrospirota bacterium]
MLTLFPPKYKTIDELSKIQTEELIWTVKHIYINSPFYREKMDKAGMIPSDIKSFDDITKLPFIDAEDLREGYPFALRSVDFKDILKIF